MSPRTLSFWSAAAIGLAIVAAWLATVYSHYLDAREQAHRDLWNVARLVEEHGSRSLDAASIVVGIVTELVRKSSLEDVARSQEHRETILRALAAAPQINAVFLLNADGRTVFHSEQPVPPAGNFSFRDYFKAHRDAGEDIFLGPIVKAATTGEHVFTLSRRLADGAGRFLGVAVASLKLSYYQSFYRALEREPDASIGIATTGATLLAREPFSDHLAEADLSQAPLFREHLPAAPNGVVEVVSPVDHEEKLLSYYASRSDGIVAFATMNKRDVLAPFWRDVVFSGTFLALILALIGVSLALRLRMFRELERSRGIAEENRSFVQSVLDSLSSQVAIVDSEGRILGVNMAWRRFGLANGGRAGDAYLGTNYVDACRSGGVEDPEGEAAAAGVIAVLAGEKQEFSMQYPCHAPDQERWYNLHVTSLQGLKGGAVISHTDISRMKRAEEELRVAAMTDSLTTLPNRRAFMDAAAKAVAAAKRLETPLSLVLLDCDHFKKINDTYGHAGGDEVLQALGAMLKAAVRETDTPARIGGEEFAVLLPAAAAADAKAWAERLRQRVAGTAIRSDAAVIRFTISLGVAELSPEAASVDALLARADEALYAAKEAGRDRVAVAAEVSTATA